MKQRKKKSLSTLSLDELKSEHIQCALIIGERSVQIYLCQEEIKKNTARMIELGVLANEIKGDSN